MRLPSLLWWSVPLLLLAAVALAPVSPRSAVVVAADGAAESDTPFPDVPDTQQNAPPLSTPEEALAAIEAPPGFRVSLFAAEPDVRQPIAIATDARGRLWVAENYTYAERPTSLDESLRDRIVILEDADGDGRSDRRTVFWDRARQLTSVEVGFGGVWAMCPPQLLFLPDRDGDDVPDGPPEVVLDGFDVGDANRHNFANGLRWGPDGWLYGRNGITHEGRVGPPGTPAERRLTIGPGVWRVHPVDRRVEMVCTGTTNPWGHDWDDHGQLFFINTVIGHLWHAPAGAHFRRMFGVDPNPFVYELLDQTADHVHWDTAEAWHQANQGLSPTTDQAGGGHAHCGMLIYLGDQWPADCRGKLYTVNLHGHRLNCDRLEREGAAYAGRHEPDFIHFRDPWFRGVELLGAPDGGVFVADWTDVGECHENDGVHRTSGRIFKIDYVGEREGKAAEGGGRDEFRLPEPLDLAALDDVELVRLQLHPDEWFVRQAGRLLQERYAAGRDLTAAREELFRLWREQPDVTRQLRALWRLHATGGLSEEWLLGELEHPSEYARAWLVTLLTEPPTLSPAAVQRLALLAAEDSSGLVLLHLASALQRMPPEARFAVARPLAAREGFANDRVLPLMIWYGVEGAVPAAPDRAVELAVEASSPTVRRLVARRLTHDLKSRPEAVNALLAALVELPAERQADVLAGVSEALRGWRRAPAPAVWPAVQRLIESSPDEALRRQARELGVVFGDGRAAAELLELAQSRGGDPPTRRAAIATLAEARAEGLAPLLVKLLDDKDVSAEAIRGLAAVAGAEAAPAIVEFYGKYAPAGREAAVEALAARPESAAVLLAAVEAGTVPVGDVPLFLIRQMQGYEDAALRERLAALWPGLRPIAEDKQARIAALAERLTPAALAEADPAAGRRLWEKSCAKCHTLFGAGGKLGPDLTGAQRTNLAYLLENVVDPSASLAPNFRMTYLALADGRVLSGVVLTRTAETWEVQTPTEKLLVPAAEIEESRETALSLMPEGQLDLLAPEEVRDLFAYLMSTRQVEPLAP